jgi:GNAT superfamily N-acetyltransferase
LVSTGFFDNALLKRVEDAGLHASATKGETDVDGWLVRLSPGKAKRSRCVNALARGAQPLADKLAQVRSLFDAAGLPLFLRITPFSEPRELDAELARRGWSLIDDTRVMVLASLEGLPQLPTPAGISSERAGPQAYAEAVGGLRGTPAPQVAAHAERLAGSPVPYEGWLWKLDGRIVACAQTAAESDLVGLYDVFTTPGQRNRGLARALCSQLLAQARERGARTAYLQVDAANVAARALYQRLGFSDGYAYHYRSPDAAAR